MQQAIQSYKTLRNTLRNEVSDSTGVKGIVTITRDVYSHLETCIGQQLVKNEIEIEGSTYTIDKINPDNQEATITILNKIEQGLKTYFIAECSKSFYLQFGRYFCIPQYLYIHDVYKSTDFDESLFKKRLEYTVKVYELLCKISDYKVSQDDCEEFFLQAAKPIVLKSYYAHGVSVFDGINETIRMVEFDSQKEINKPFLKTQIQTYLNEVKEEDRFTALLNNFKTIHQNFLIAVDLYFHSYDQNKARNDLDDKKIDLLKKLYGVINEVGAKVITVPAAYFLILKEFKTDQPTVSINFVFFAVAVLYGFIIQLSISKQFKYLVTLKNDKEEFLKKPATTPELRELMGRYTKELNDGYVYQKFFLIAITIIVWLLPVIVLGMIYL